MVSVIIFFAVTVAAFGMAFLARKVKGYADCYEIPRKQHHGYTIQLKPVRYAAYVIGVTSFYFLLLSAVYAVIPA